VSFASAGFVPFLVAVFFLYASIEQQRSTSVIQRWSSLVASALLTWALADALWLLVIPGGRLLDPIGLALAPWSQHTFSTYAPLMGPLAFALGWASARRWGAISQGQRARAWAAAGALAALGGAVLWAARAHRLPSLSAALSPFGHPLWLCGWGAVRGLAARDEDPAALRLARQIALFLVSAGMYHSWAVTTRGAYQYLLALILGTVVLDYFLALWIGDRTSRSPAARPPFALLIASLVANLGILAVFKYWDFFGRTAQWAATHAGLSWTFVPAALLLPAGISFHTFQSLSYTVDVYRAKLRATPSLIEFATFVLFFPQLVAGPIVRAEEFLRQIADPPPIREAHAAEGMLRVLRGLAKKLALADPLSVYLVDRVFERPGAFSSLENLLAVYGYAFQIYLDFSAYSDIAIGSAALLGFTLPENFRTPYRSSDLAAFWRRWHITLSSWLRDYLYIPLGGSRGSDARTYRNLFITMLLGGLWHGANWTFIAWGALHGGGLAITRAMQRARERSGLSLSRLASATGALALGGALIHTVISGTVRAMAARAGVDPAWPNLLFGWLYLAPAWAALTVWADARAERGSLVAKALGALLTFHYVCFAWVFFRAESFDRAREVLAAIAERTLDHPNVPRWFVAALLAAALSHVVPDRAWTLARDRFVRAHYAAKAALLVAAFVALRSITLPASVPFIYFQF
jgi:D-alanyl-lipoteichoic acid acyltransferase DltB (MBOAT superfamily)